MSKFSIDKKGYSTKEVDDYINNLCLKYEEKLSQQQDRIFALKNEVEEKEKQLSNYVDKDRQISQALIYAVEKAEQIESSSKRIYDLEIKRVRLLYERWKDLLIEVESKYPQINNNGYIVEAISEFKKAIDDVFEQNFSISKTKTNANLNIKENLKKNGDNYIKNILNKMDYTFNSQSENNNEINLKEKHYKKVELNNILASHNKENSRINEIGNRLSLISGKANLKQGEDYIDEFLNSDFDNAFANTAYAKNITRKPVNKDDSPFNYPYPTPNESGFDLKDALSPKEDLDEIMKAFKFNE
jgi:cell division septum initiation protein DivIVA